MTMYNPVSTYRIQFNKDFTFHQLEEIIPYLEDLGVKTVYASPIFRAVPGSNHGYDVVDPTEINPEIGTEEDLRRLITKLQKSGIGWIQDIVPNHMAYHPENPWLMDVLEKGDRSVYTGFFDVPGTSDFFEAPLMVPFLGAPLDELLAVKEISIVFESGRLSAKYGDQQYPLNIASYKKLLSEVEFGENALSPDLYSDLNALEKTEDAVTLARDWKLFVRNINTWAKDPATTPALIKSLEEINNNPKKLKSILDLQHYRLCDWKETNSQINFRRFFTVNGLICLNMDSELVFEKYHETIFQFVREGLFNGIRVDHIDGLYDPVKYMHRLRHHCGEDVFIIVEKILEPGESLDTTWPIEGTSGYGFLALVNNLFTRNSAENKFSKFYQKLTKDDKPVEKKIHEKKANILRDYMGGELSNLHRFFIQLNLADTPSEIHHPTLREAIGLFLIHCPIYRFYGNSFPLENKEREDIQALFKDCKKNRPDLVASLEILEKVLLINPSQRSKDYNERVQRFYQRCMQFTGPLMAKGVEDTLMYTFNRFLGHNEVGDSPEFFGLTTADFHSRMVERQNHWPLALNATSTHDTKRGEDARMRLNVLPDLATSWIDHASHWIEINSAYKTDGWPDANEEYFIYQTLIGSYPMTPEDNYLERLDAYFMKAFREAKRHSDWADPDTQHETAVQTFVKKLLDPKNAFLPAFTGFQKTVSDHGMIVSLAQLILKFTCPGVPDNYQGTSGWDLSLVDPDNRRRVDYDLRQESLDAVTANLEPLELMRKLWDTRTDSRIKLWMANALYHLRSEYADLFRDGVYVPLEVRGKYRENCIAFARQHKGTWIVTAVPLSLARIADLHDGSIDLDWADTEIVLPEEAPTAWNHVLLGTSGSHKGSFKLSEIFEGLPYAILVLKNPTNDRKAGVLLSLTSLPSPYGIGDMGPEARAFADFLGKSGQSLWQLLPVTVTDKSSFHSPYSSCSGMAGNPLLISLDDLVAENLLDQVDLENKLIRNSGKANFSSAERLKDKLLQKVWLNFRAGKSQLQSSFEKFKKQEAFWLDDFALYEVMRQSQDGAPWYEWPLEYRNRESTALEKFVSQTGGPLEKSKFIQFLFFHQWKKLRAYCSVRNIQLVGDIPFYVAYDSADVWANRAFFAVGGDGRMTAMAGVPPDYFNDDGQLWHMPVFHWDVLEKNDYRWWIDRIRKNLDLFDIVRLDHFRAFVDYWEVPAGETTARGGTWKDGPGKPFFEALDKALGIKPGSGLPLIAEDLGDVSPGVFVLRDEIGLPGMKILHFAFHEDMPTSIFAVHNFTPPFIVYTGTHDNNTTRGWYRQDLSSDDRGRLNAYCNSRINERNVSEVLIRMAYGSVANTAIIPMQDLMNLKEKARMNTPATTDINWLWRMDTQPSDPIGKKLLELTRIYNRL